MWCLIASISDPCPLSYFFLICKCFKNHEKRNCLVCEIVGGLGKENMRKVANKGLFVGTDKNGRIKRNHVRGLARFSHTESPI